MALSETDADPDSDEEEKQAEKGEEGEEPVQKAVYYYAQALLIFYYLIPDTEVQDLETNTLKLKCHLGQARCLLK